MKDHGYSEAAVKTLWDILLPFSDYAFNRAHSAAYGVVSYWTAYLKANYPAEYMSGVLTSVRDDKDKAAVYRSEEHTSELQSRQYLVCRLLLEKKKYNSAHIAYTALCRKGQT